MRLAPLLILPLLLSGCFADVLAGSHLTTLDFTCMVLDTEGPPLHIQVHLEPGLGYEPGVPVERLGDELARVSGRPPEAITWTLLEGPPPPPDGWDPATLQEAAAHLATEHRGELRLHVLWIASGDLDEPSGYRVAPGVVAVVQEEVAKGAGRTGLPLDDVATAVLLHYVGHALGQVNDGIPVQDREIAKRENPPKHDPVQESVMHIGWHAASSMPAETHLQYRDAIVRDWRLAEVCP